MLGDTLTITHGGSGGSAKVLKQINQDGYSSEYFLNDGTDRWRAIVRHAKEAPRNGGLPYDRHTVIFRAEYGDGTTDNPYGIQEAILTIRLAPSDTPANVSNLVEGLAYWASEANILKIIGWES
jgi:hypothetical protein